MSSRRKMSASAGTAFGSTKKAATTVTADYHHDHDHDYSELLEQVRQSYNRATGPLFETDASGLFELYLDSLPAERQVHNCHACRRFLQRYGGLVTVTEDNDLHPVMFSVQPRGFYAETFSALRTRVKKASITGRFLTTEKVWGEPKTGPWKHMAVTPRAEHVYPTRGAALTAGQREAELRENYRIVREALGYFTKAHLRAALAILKGDAVTRAAKFVGPVEFLLDLHEAPKGRRGDHYIWKRVANAPDGFCHPRGSVIGTLLEDIAAGLSTAQIKRRWDEKLHPLKYQRSQVAPTQGNVKAAEDLVKKLGLATALKRRYATLADVKLHALWLPKTTRTAPGAGVFGSVRTKTAAKPGKTSLPDQTMTWVKFRDRVLPGAVKIEAQVPFEGPYYALATAVDKKAPPLLKWDNQVSWYTYPNGSRAVQWGLPSGCWVDVTSVVPLPNLWGDRPMTFVAEGVVLTLKKARDTNDPGLALFPELLRTELHAARATIEQYSRQNRLAVPAASTELASGLGIRQGATSGLRLRVTTADSVAVYTIDRWD